MGDGQQDDRWCEGEEGDEESDEKGREESDEESDEEGDEEGDEEAGNEEGCRAEVDGEEDNRQEIDREEIHGTQVDGTQVVRPQIHGTQIARTQGGQKESELARARRRGGGSIAARRIDHHPREGIVRDADWRVRGDLPRAPIALDAFHHASAIHHFLAGRGLQRDMEFRVCHLDATAMQRATDEHHVDKSRDLRIVCVLHGRGVARVPTIRH